MEGQATNRPSLPPVLQLGTYARGRSGNCAPGRTTAAGCPAYRDRHGELAGVLVVAAAAVAIAELATFTLSLAMAPSEDIATSSWFGLDSLGAGLRDYATVLGGVTGWAIFGTTLAVIFRSAPLALAVGFAWAGPFENILVDSWSAGYRLFPGQVLESLVRGGTIELGIGRAVVSAVLYAGMAAMIALVLVSRRDVTA